VGYTLEAESFTLLDSLFSVRVQVQAVFSLFQQAPIVVDVIKQPEPARDISIDYIITMFATAGVVLLVAAIGGLIAGAIFIALRRLRDASAPPTESSHVRLRI
jgi:hypothetical protein